MAEPVSPNIQYTTPSNNSNSNTNTNTNNSNSNNINTDVNSYLPDMPMVYDLL